MIADITKTPIAEQTEALPGNWTLHEYASVTSTNLVAAHLPLWNAVRADIQTAGRGRFQRHWISDAGGLWLSAVVPLPPQAAARNLFPLAVGLAVCNFLSALDVPNLRMRWPNDILLGNRKLAGLLIDQFAPGRTVAGIGLNVRNQPEAHDNRLLHQTTRLADVLLQPPPLRQLTALLLDHLRQVLVGLETDGPTSLLPQLAPLWGPPRPVELDLDGELHRGLFTGVDRVGRLLLSEPTGEVSCFAPDQVRHLQELNGAELPAPPSPNHKD